MLRQGSGWGRRKDGLGPWFSCSHGRCSAAVISFSISLIWINHNNYKYFIFFLWFIFPLYIQFWVHYKSTYNKYYNVPDEHPVRINPNGIVKSENQYNSNSSDSYLSDSNLNILIELTFEFDLINIYTFFPFQNFLSSKNETGWIPIEVAFRFRLKQANLLFLNGWNTMTPKICL